jgi:hypothetical protein
MRGNGFYAVGPGDIGSEIGKIPGKLKICMYPLEIPSLVSGKNPPLIRPERCSQLWLKKRENQFCAHKSLTTIVNVVRPSSFHLVTITLHNATEKGVKVDPLHWYTALL